MRAFFLRADIQRFLAKALDIKVTEAHVNASGYLMAVAIESLIDDTSWPSRTPDFLNNVYDYYMRKGSISAKQAATILNILLRTYKERIALETRAEVVATEIVQERDSAIYVDFSNDTTGMIDTDMELIRNVPNGIYTVVSSDESDYVTIKLSDCPGSYNKPAYVQIASFLHGPDNSSDYLGFAFVTCVNHSSIINNTAYWKAYKKQSRMHDALSILLKGDKVHESGKRYAMQSNRCYICNRPLTVPFSVKHGIGPICAKNIGFVPDDQSIEMLVYGEPEHGHSYAATGEVIAAFDHDELFPESAEDYNAAMYAGRIKEPN